MEESMMTRTSLRTVLLSFATAGAAFSQAPPTLVEGKGAQVRLPANWKCNERLLTAGGPISCTNFTGPYQSGGLLPPGGAEIEITRIPRPIGVDTSSRADS